MDPFRQLGFIGIKKVSQRFLIFFLQKVMYGRELLVRSWPFTLVHCQRDLMDLDHSYQLTLALGVLLQLCCLDQTMELKRWRNFLVPVFNSSSRWALQNNQREKWICLWLQKVFGISDGRDGSAHYFSTSISESHATTRKVFLLSCNMYVYREQTNILDQFSRRPNSSYFILVSHAKCAVVLHFGMIIVESLIIFQSSSLGKEKF